MAAWFGKQSIAVRIIVIVLGVGLLTAPLCVVAGGVGCYFWARKGVTEAQKKTGSDQADDAGEKDTMPPFLTIYEPKATAATDQKQITVKGRAEAGCQLTVNGVEKELEKTGLFGFLYDLSPGGNSISVVACDKAGNKTTRQVLVTYNPPPPPPPAPAPSSGGGGSAPSGPSICATCGGIGLITCPECGGQGWFLCGCGYDPGCPLCGGFGAYPCGTCGGNVLVDCPDCGG